MTNERCMISLISLKTSKTMWEREKVPVTNICLPFQNVLDGLIAWGHRIDSKSICNG